MTPSGFQPESWKRDAAAPASIPAISGVCQARCLLCPFPGFSNFVCKMIGLWTSENQQGGRGWWPYNHVFPSPRTQRLAGVWHRGHILFLLSATQLSYLLMDRIAMIADCRGAGSSPPMLGAYNSREAFTTHSKGLSLDLLAYESLSCSFLT